MVHLGTLLAILIYFWRDVIKLIKGALLLLKREVTPEGGIVIYIGLATVPAIAFGLVLEKLNMPDLERNVAVVAWNSILYAILMLIADMLRPQTRALPHDPRRGSVHRRSPGARADPGHEPLRRHHNGRRLLRFQPARLQPASLSC